MPQPLRRIRKIFTEQIITNWQYKLLALGAALVVWAFVAGQQMIRMEVQAPIHFGNIPRGSRLADQKVTVATVTLIGQRDKILGLQERKIRVDLDLSGLHNGDNAYLISFREVVIPNEVEVKDITPRQLSIKLVPVEGSNPPSIAN